VTYKRSKQARMQESERAGGGDFYDRVYDADRPELFFKATPARVVGPGGTLRLRRDSKWIVPEPELVLLLNQRGDIVGYTVGNDLSCRDIEGENPLYLPQAKTFDGCAALGPAVLITTTPLPETTAVELRIERAGATCFEGETTLAQMHRKPADLAAWLFRECSFSQGVFLMTGTGIVPPDDFSLKSGDTISIRIAPIGTLSNRVA
jgi:2-dehydro-3-deoxy-D-arabinonate dehydratase